MCEQKNLRIIQLYLNTNFLVQTQLEAISSVKNYSFGPIFFLLYRVQQALYNKSKIIKIGFLEKK